MLNIIKSDFYRILKGKALYIVFIITILLTIVSVVGVSAGHIGISTASNIDLSDTALMEQISQAKSLKEFREIMLSQQSFALDKDMIGQNINLYYFFIVFVVIILATDFSNKSIKNTLSSTISRREYYVSKLLFILILSTILILFNNYFAYFLNLVVNGKNFASSFSEITKLTFIQLPLLYGMISLLVCFVFLFQKTSTFNAVAIPFIMVVQLIGLGTINLFKIKVDWFYDYEVQFALAKLSQNPTNPYIVKCLILGFIYIVIFNLLGYYTFKNTEIK